MTHDAYSFAQVVGVPDAACQRLGVSVDLFFPEQHDPETVEAAKAICATCRGREECLRGALERGEKFGIWGGTSEYERRKLRTAIRPQLIAERKERQRRQVMQALRWGPVDMTALCGLVEGADSAVRITLQTLRKEGLVDVGTNSLGDKAWFLTAREDVA